MVAVMLMAVCCDGNVRSLLFFFPYYLSLFNTDEAAKVKDHEVRQPSASPLSQKVSEQAHMEKGEQVKEWYICEHACACVLSLSSCCTVVY